MASFMRSAQARNAALGASTSQAHESAVAEVGLMLRVSARTAAARVGGAWSLCTRMPATLTALEQGRITLDKARILDAETLNLSRDTPPWSSSRCWPKRDSRHRGSYAPPPAERSSTPIRRPRRNEPSKPGVSGGADVAGA
jgi:Domain of unknown function (DUF222)